LFRPSIIRPLSYILASPCGNPVFEGLGLEQQWHPPWLLLELIMTPKKSKISTDMAEPSAAATVAAEPNVAHETMWQQERQQSRLCRNRS
jgi:hypothetical protein